jgi:hypothetical protein
MPINPDKLLSLWNLEDIRACDEGIRLAQVFFEASGECVRNLGLGRTSSTRFDLLSSYNTMVKHADECEKCSQVTPGAYRNFQTFEIKRI